MTMEEIREKFHVPAKRGGGVRLLLNGGGTKPGVITGSRGDHLLVKHGDEPSIEVHPATNIEYAGQDYDEPTPKSNRARTSRPPAPAIATPPIDVDDVEEPPTLEAATNDAPAVAE